VTGKGPEWCCVRYGKEPDHPVPSPGDEHRAIREKGAAALGGLELFGSGSETAITDVPDPYGRVRPGAGKKGAVTVKSGRPDLCRVEVDGAEGGAVAGINKPCRAVLCYGNHKGAGRAGKADDPAGMSVQRPDDLPARHPPEFRGPVPAHGCKPATVRHPVQPDRAFVEPAGEQAAVRRGSAGGEAAVVGRNLRQGCGIVKAPDPDHPVAVPDGKPPCGCRGADNPPGHPGEGPAFFPGGKIPENG